MSYAAPLLAIEPVLAESSEAEGEILDMTAAHPSAHGLGAGPKPSLADVMDAAWAGPSTDRWGGWDALASGGAGSISEALSASDAFVLAEVTAATPAAAKGPALDAPARGPGRHAHPDDRGQATEHDRLLELLPRKEATHIAVRDGDWFDPDTWAGGRIPDEDARVLIPKKISVTYDGASDASLFGVRVRGELAFATDIDTKMVVDTLVVAPKGRLEIGTAKRPVRAGVEAEILIPDNGDIDVGWDPTLLSRGVISHGTVKVHGAEKTAFLKVAAAPMAGDTTIELAKAPEGWRVGDTLVLTGTHKQGWGAVGGRLVHRESQDEEVTITAITGGRVSIDQPLAHDHDAPRQGLNAYVANMTRNVTIASEDGEATLVHRRGHVMFMHSDDVDVRYAAFDDLGRTDKSEPARDVATVKHIAADSNIKGRYSLHFHKTGTEDQDHPAIALGNTVSGSAGWGFVHHSSHADFIENVAFDAFGAGFAAEDGDETGSWLRNLAIKSEGIGYGDWTVKDGDDVGRHDNGRTGDGFFFAGRLVEAAENVAANTTNGFVWMHRSAPSGPLSANLDQPETAYGEPTLRVDRAVIHGFRDNEAFGTHSGIIVVKAVAHQNHDVRTVMDGFLNWETAEGVNLSYTAHYTLKDIDLLYTGDRVGVHGDGNGVMLGTNAFDMVFNGLKLEGFARGVNFDGDLTFGGDDFENILIDASFARVGQHYVGFNSERHKVLSSDDLAPGRLEFEMRGDTVIANDDDRLVLRGVKTDSIGARSRNFDGDRQEIFFNENLARLLATDGYHTTCDGTKVMLVEDFVADRATGELMKFAHVLTLQLTDEELQHSWMLDQLGGAVYRGRIKLGGPAPKARNDEGATETGKAVKIDVLANDADPDGGRPRVDGLTDPTHGEVSLRANGSLRYTPDHGFEGTDRFAYWAADREGNFTRAVVTVEVWDM